MTKSGDLQTELSMACFWLRNTGTMVVTLPLAEREIGPAGGRCSLLICATAVVQDSRVG